MPPGVYKVKICSKVALANPPEEKCTEIDVELTDPCDPPASISVPSFTDQIYYISDPNKAQYTHPDFTADPSFCKVTYTYDLGSILNKDGVERSAVTNTGKVFDFFYDEDLAPVQPNP